MRLYPIDTLLCQVETVSTISQTRKQSTWDGTPWNEAQVCGIPRNVAQVRGIPRNKAQEVGVPGSGAQREIRTGAEWLSDEK